MSDLRDDVRIKAVACLGYCFQGFRGMDRCGKCDGSGSQLVIPGGKRFPNTEAGYRKALNKLDGEMG